MHANWLESKYNLHKQLRLMMKSCYQYTSLILLLILTYWYFRAIFCSHVWYKTRKRVIYSALSYHYSLMHYHRTPQNTLRFWCKREWKMEWKSISLFLFSVAMEIVCYSLTTLVGAKPIRNYWLTSITLQLIYLNIKFYVILL